MGVRLTPDEQWATLEAAHTGIFTSLRRDGAPIALPVWYAVLDRAVYVGGPARTKKWKRIERDPRVSFLVETGLKWRELKAVQLNGRAVFVEDKETLRRVGEKMDERYAAFRTQRSAMPSKSQKHYGSGSRTIRIEPEGRILTWDNAKLQLDE